VAERIYTFNEVGSIPGIPGQFAGVRLRVDEESREILEILPLVPATAPPEDVAAPPGAAFENEAAASQVNAG